MPLQHEKVLRKLKEEQAAGRGAPRAAKAQARFDQLSADIAELLEGCLLWDPTQRFTLDHAVARSAKVWDAPPSIFAPIIVAATAAEAATAAAAEAAAAAAAAAQAEAVCAVAAASAAQEKCEEAQAIAAVAAADGHGGRGGRGEEGRGGRQGDRRCRGGRPMKADTAAAAAAAQEAFEAAQALAAVAKLEAQQFVGRACPHGRHRLDEHRPRDEHRRTQLQPSPDRTRSWHEPRRRRAPAAGPTASYRSMAAAQDDGSPDAAQPRRIVPRFVGRLDEAEAPVPRALGALGAADAEPPRYNSCGALGASYRSAADMEPVPPPTTRRCSRCRSSSARTRASS